jgi:hypothetical protein
MAVPVLESAPLVSLLAEPILVEDVMVELASSAGAPMALSSLVAEQTVL